MRAFRIFADYNASFNRRLNTVLTASFDHLPRALIEQVNHLFVMDRLWLDRLVGGTATEGICNDMGRMRFADVTTWWRERERLDREISDFVAGVVILDEEIRFVTKADTVAVACRKDDALVHLFNHQSLHRGEILRILADHRVGFGNSDILPHIVRPIAPE